MSVSGTLDNLRDTTQNNFVMGFDNNASYLIRGASFDKGADGEYRLVQQNKDAPVLQTSKRGSAGVYEVPLYDAKAASKASTITDILAESMSAVRACKADIFCYPDEPKWQDIMYKNVIYDAKVVIPSANVYALAKSIMHKHRQWGHPGPEVLRQILIEKGTKRSLRLAKRVHDLFEPCNACLSGGSTKRPHVRDHSQPSTKATRPMQHIAADCTGEQNIVSMGTPTLSGASIIYEIIDTYSHYIWIWLIKSTAQVTPIVSE